MVAEQIDQSGHSATAQFHLKFLTNLSHVSESPDAGIITEPRLFRGDFGCTSLRCIELRSSFYLALLGVFNGMPPVWNLTMGTLRSSRWEIMYGSPTTVILTFCGRKGPKTCKVLDS